MPSPFPGMDPYLESPHIFPDFHNRLATEISSILNLSLPPPYYARLEMRPEVGIAEDENGDSRRIVPDITVVRQFTAAVGTGTAVLESPRTAVSHSYEFAIPDESLHHHFVEVRDSLQGHKLITLIEIVSPSNKHPGPDRISYLQKQSELLASDVNLIEIDLLRTGTRLFSIASDPSFLAAVTPPPDYLVIVSRYSQQAKMGRRCQVFCATLRQMLPCFPVPLRENDMEIPLDLQFVFNRAYDTGPYRRGAVDYRRPPHPALPANDAAWAAEKLKSVI